MNISELTKLYDDTCSINNLKPNHITFIRKYEYISYFKNIKVNFPLGVIAPIEIKNKSYDHLSDNIRFYFSYNVDYDFTLIHNSYREHTDEFKMSISRQTHIHPSVIYDVEGIKVAFDDSGKKIQFIHTGGVEIQDNVEVGPYTVIHRATMDMTIIKQGVKIGAHCNIGHNNIIGENTVIASGAMTSGSVIIGKNCWLGTGCLIRNGISICDNVVIGIGSVVVKDINEPGIYAGNPAKYIKEKKENWNF